MSNRIKQSRQLCMIIQYFADDGDRWAEECDKDTNSSLALHSKDESRFIHHFLLNLVLALPIVEVSHLVSRLHPLIAAAARAPTPPPHPIFNLHSCSAHSIFPMIRLQAMALRCDFFA